MNNFSEPKTITKTQKIHAFEAIISNIVFNKSATIDILFYDEASCVVASKELILAGEDYAKWGNDDNYITEYIITHLDKIIMQ